MHKIDGTQFRMKSLYENLRQVQATRLVKALHCHWSNSMTIWTEFYFGQ